MDKRERLRRKHVQATSECAGFCMKCGQAVPPSHHGAGKRCPYCNQPTLILDREEERVIIEWNGTKYQTAYDGWTRRTVAGEERYTKRMDDGQLVSLDRLAAARYGLVVSETEGAPIPSVPMTGGSWYSKLPAPTPLRTAGKGSRSDATGVLTVRQGERTGKPKKPKLGDSGLLSHGALGKAISTEAKKLVRASKEEQARESLVDDFLSTSSDGRKSQIVEAKSTKKKATKKSTKKQRRKS